MGFGHPDDVVLAYQRAHEGASSAKTLEIGGTFRAYADRCAAKKCRAKRSRDGLKPNPTTAFGKGGELVAKCRKCGAPWLWTEAFVLAGESHPGTKGGRPPAALLRSGDLAALVGKLEQTDELEDGFAEVYVAWLCAGSKTLDAVAEDATRINFKGRPWARKDVRRAVEHARDWLETELYRRGQLDREG